MYVFFYEWERDGGKRRDDRELENETHLSVQIVKRCYPRGSLFLFSSLSLYLTLFMSVPSIFSLWLRCGFLHLALSLPSISRWCHGWSDVWNACPLCRSCLMVAPCTQALAERITPLSMPQYAPPLKWRESYGHGTVSLWIFKQLTAICG